MPVVMEVILRQRLVIETGERTRRRLHRRLGERRAHDIDRDEKPGPIFDALGIREHEGDHAQHSAVRIQHRSPTVPVGHLGAGSQRGPAAVHGPLVRQFAAAQRRCDCGVQLRRLFQVAAARISDDVSRGAH